MAYDASEILGAPQVGGARVMAKGFVRRHVASQLNVVGGAAGAVLSSSATEIVNNKQKKERPGADAPDVNAGFLAATEGELALVSIKVGVVKSKLGDVVTRVPRSKVASIEYGGGAMSKLTVVFTDETRWEFDVPKNGAKAAKDFAEAISA
jgi:hypothetical protein